MWKCYYYATTTAPDGTSRRLEGYFDGAKDGDLYVSLQAVLAGRIRKMALWYGVEVVVCTPLGQKFARIIEEDPNRKLRLILVKRS